jgi:hypothetical protein
MARLENMKNEFDTENLLLAFKESLNSVNNKYILKLKSFEEFMFGDYPIGTYESVRSLVREYEVVKLILMRYDREVVNPNITNFPPIIYIPYNKEYTYTTLLTQYLNLYKSIIHRFKPEKKYQEFYFQNSMNRHEKLTKYNESGECDFPFNLTIKGIKDLFAFKNFMDSKAYTEGGMDLPYFRRIPSLDLLKKKKNFFQNIYAKLFNLCKNKSVLLKEKEEKQQEHEQHEHEKHLKNMSKKYKDNLELSDKLNDLKIQLKKQKGEKMLRNLLKGSHYLKYTDEKIKHLQADNPKGKENFSLNNYKLPFLLSMIKLEVIILYGSYEIQKLSTRFFIVDNDININEKITFNKLLISHLPRETRISFNLYAYDKSQSSKKQFVLGSCSTPLYNENGIMYSGVIEMNLWPLVSIDPRIVCTFPYLGKHSINEQSQYNKKDYCRLYIEFPKFIRPVAYTLKSPQSYIEFLKLKYPKEQNNVNNINEIKSLYANSLDHFEYILDSLRNRDAYFMELDKKRKEQDRKKENSIEEETKLLRADTHTEM